MADVDQEQRGGEPDWLSEVFKQLRAQGIELENLCSDFNESSEMKVICVAADMGSSFRELRKHPRGETVMVRIDAGDRQMLDAWVETGHFKSRSEAAALFIKEGLKIRASELETLRDAIEEVKQARMSLQVKAGSILGQTDNQD